MRFVPGQAGRWQPAAETPPPPSARATLPAGMTEVSSPPPRLSPQRRWLSLAIVLVGALIGLRMLAFPHQPALAPVSRPWTAKVGTLTYVGGDPATLEVNLALTNGSPEAVRLVQAVLTLPEPLKDSLAHTTSWDPLLDGETVDYWASQTSRTLTFSLKLAGLKRDEALTLLEQASLQMKWSPADLDPQGTRLDQTLRFADLWPAR